MKTWKKGLVIVATLALLLAGLARTYKARDEREQALQAQTASQKVEVTLQVQAQDLLTVQVVTLDKTQPITAVVSPLRATLVKARVPGELLQLAVREGESVKPGEVLARTDDTQIKANVAMSSEQLKASQAQLAIAQRAYDNNQDLAKQGFISETALANARASLDAAKANVASAQAALSISQSNLNDTILRAPIGGRVAQKFAQPGELLGLGAPVLEIIDPSQIELEASLPAHEAPVVRGGQIATLADPTSPQSVVQGQVTRVNPKADPMSRSVKFYLRITRQNQLYPGQFLQGHVRVGEIKGLGLPLTAIRTDAPTPFVQVLRASRVVHQDVTIQSRGELQGKPFVLLEGLQAGDTVLAGSLGLIRSGTLTSTATPNAAK